MIPGMEPLPVPPPQPLPLEGITVVAVEQAVAAPFATRQLADLGARVIKVERIDGVTSRAVTTRRPAVWPRISCGATGARSPSRWI